MSCVASVTLANIACNVILIDLFGVWCLTAGIESLLRVFQMHQQGILKTDDLITRFFRLCTEMCVDLCYRALGEQTHSPTLIRAKCFHTLDAFVRLIALLVKHSGDNANTVTKINLLNKVEYIPL